MALKAAAAAADPPLSLELVIWAIEHLANRSFDSSAPTNPLGIPIIAAGKI